MAEKVRKDDDVDQLLADLEASHPAAVAELIRSEQRYDGYRPPTSGIADDTITAHPADTQE